MGIGLFFFLMGIGEKRWGVSLIGAFIFTQGIMDWGCGFKKDSCGTANTKMPESVKFDSKESIRELEDSELDGAPKGPVPEPLKDRFAVLGNSLVFLAMHNAYHTGQVNLLAALEVEATSAA